MSNPAGNNQVLGLFAKRPDPGTVKTRLAAESSPEWAAQVAEALLLDTMDKLARIPVRHVLAFAPADAEAYFAERSRGRFSLMPQAAGDLGQRMVSFFRQELQKGAQAVILVGTDSPTLPLPLIEQAFGELAHADVVLGPATDGGYYLVGCGRKLPPIFDAIPWSTDRVLAETVTRLAGSSWKLALLPPWYDVDTLSDWQMLVGHVAAMQRAGVDPELSRIHKLLNTTKGQ
jgi:rSAM/selenodomain-associated transferase 1